MLVNTAASSPFTPQKPQWVLALGTTTESQVHGMAFVPLHAMRMRGAMAEIMFFGPAADPARREPAVTAVTPRRPMNATPRQMLEGFIRAGVRTKVYAPTCRMPVSVLGR